MPIGDYVHLHAANVNTDSATQSLAAQRKRMSDKAIAMSGPTLKDAELLKDSITKLRGILENPEKTPQDNQISLALQNHIQSLIGDQLMNLDFSTGQIKLREDRVAIGKIRTEAYKSGKTIVSRFHQLAELSGLATGTRVLSYGKLKSIVDRAKQQTSTIAQDALDNLRSLSLPSRGGNPMADLLREQIREFNSNKDGNVQVGKELRRVLNDCIAVMAPMAAIRTAQGAFWEDMLSILQITQEQYAKKKIEDIAEELTKLMKENVKGNKKARVAFQTDRWNEPVAKKLLIHKTQDGVFSWTAHGNPSQGKVDVILEASTLGTSTDLRISAKSVSLAHGGSGWIHAVSDTNLLAILGDEDSDFINHYANIFAIHEDDNKFSEIKNCRTAYLQIVQFLSAIKALTGDVTRISLDGQKVDDSANIFVVNDVLTGDVKIVPMRDLISRLLDKIPEESIGTGGTISLEVNGVKTSGGKYQSLLLKNDATPDKKDKWQRVASVYAQMHSQKISVSIHASLLNLTK